MSFLSEANNDLHLFRCDMPQGIETKALAPVMRNAELWYILGTFLIF